MPKRGWAALALLATVIQLFVLYRPAGPPSELSAPGLDKVGHFVIFALPVLLILLAVSVRGGRVPRARLAIVPAVFAAHAVISELIQGTWYSHREGDPFDTLADLLGCACGVGCYFLAARLPPGGRQPTVKAS